MKDTVAPIATAKNVVILPGDSIYPDDFIDTVVDATECTYEFVTDTSEIDLNTPGEYEIEIKVLDAYENETTVSSKLIIDENAPQEYLYCEGVGTSSETYENAKIYQTYKYGISGTGDIYNMLKIITYKFDTLEDYELAVENIDENTFDENEGKIGLDPERFTITVTQVTDENTLSTEFNLTPFPKTSLEMEEYHNGKEELCYTDIE